MFSSPIFAGPYIDDHKRQLGERLVSASTNQLIWTRSINNTYGMFCEKLGSKEFGSKEHRFFSKITSPILTKYIVTVGMKKSDWGFTGDVKYHYRKKKLIQFQKKYGSNMFCTCVLDYFFRGEQCFNEIETNKR